jgi:Flp pilus assembly protein TadD
MKIRRQESTAAAIERGQRLLVERRYEELLEFLQEAVRRFPKDPEIRLLYATSLLEIRPDDAVREATKAIDLDPDEPIRLTRAARLLFNMAEIEVARSYATRAAELTPDGFLFTAELANLGGLLRALDGEDELAEEALRMAMELKPDQEGLARDLAKFLADRGRVEEAVKVIDQALKLAKRREELERLREEIAGRTASDKG